MDNTCIEIDEKNIKIACADSLDKTEEFNESDNELLDYDNSKVICCGMKKNTLLKRMFLPIIPGGVCVIVFFNEIRYSYIYFPLIVFSASFVLFMNYPILVVRSNLRPVYFGNDLFIDREKLPYLALTRREKKELLLRIKWLLILLFSMLSAALSDYWLLKTENTTSYFEILGVTGGILKLFQLVTHLLASLLLENTRDKAYNKARKNSDLDIIEIEMKEIDLKHKQEISSINDQKEADQNNRCCYREKDS